MKGNLFVAINKLHMHVPLHTKAGSQPDPDGRLQSSIRLFVSIQFILEVNLMQFLNSTHSGMFQSKRLNVLKCRMVKIDVR